MARHLVLSLLTTSLFNSLGLAQQCTPPTPNPDYCKTDEWKNDPLVLLFEEYKPYANYVCTAALQPVVLRPGTTSTHTVGGPTSTVKETTTTTSTETDQTVTTTTTTASEKTSTSSQAIATITSYDQTATITVVVNHGVPTTLTGDTVYQTVATETSTHTVFTSTETIISGTNVDYAYNYETDLETRTGTAKFTFTTGTNTRNLPREPQTVHEIKTVVLTKPVKETHVRHTSTYDLNPVWTTKHVIEITGTETDYVTVCTRTAFQTKGTVKQTVATRTDIALTTSTETVRNVETNIITTYTGTTTDVFTTQTEYEPDWWLVYKRSNEVAEDVHHFEKRVVSPAGKLADRRKRKDDWIDNYGFDHFKSACSCLVTFPLPTKTKSIDTAVQETVAPTATTTETCTVTDVATTVSTSTAKTEASGPTTTITVPYTSTRHICETAYVTVTVDSTMFSFDTYTPTKDVTHTVDETKGAIATEYDDLDITKTSSVVVHLTSSVIITQSEGVDATVTSYFDTTVTETDLETSTFTTTDGTTTAGDVLTRTIPIEATETDKLVKTVTIYTDGTTTIDVTATETVGVITTSTVLTITTVGQNITRTITSTVELEKTISATATETVTCGFPIKNGGFEEGEEPWYLSWSDKSGGYIDSPGYWSDNAFYTNNLHDNRLMEMYQDMVTCPYSSWDCSYRFLFTNYYEFWYPDQNRNDPYDSPYVPYIRVYFNDDKYPTSNRWPTSDWWTGWWIYGEFSFTASSTGRDRIWFDAASPQPLHTQNTTQGINPGGDNHILIDNIQCWPASQEQKK
ncbi:Fc.00g114550.m01.CDS01 [Cosmosporella sp. VM-42]